MDVLRTVVWYVYFFGSLLGLVPQMRRAQRLRQQGDEEGARAIVNRWVPRWAHRLMAIAGVTVTVTGEENIPKGRAVVFTPNHQGNYDIPLMLVCLGAPTALVAKIETKKIPLVRTWMQLLDCVFLDRDNTRQALGAMRQASALLEAGKSVVVFPEGTRSRCDTMGEFKPGAFHIATQVGAPIVPVVIEGTYRAMELHHGWMHPTHVNVAILPPIETAGLSRTQRKELPGQVAAQIEAVRAALQQARRE
jgi:1-acyl-sn-glycerol-3-phosphate acyltransferase